MSSGSGPGPQAPDGCSVALYRRLPYLGELDAVRPLFEPGASVLELGCGTGRLTRVLLEWGLKPACVDNSAEMLAEVPAQARRVLSSIESLELDERFDVALLAACLVNHPVPAIRIAFLRAAAAHLKPGGRILLERHDPRWLQSAETGVVGRAGPVQLDLLSVKRDGPMVDMRLRYRIEDSEWTHAFTAETLDEPQVEALLQARGFRAISWHGPTRRWATATLSENAA